MSLSKLSPAMSCLSYLDCIAAVLWDATSRTWRPLNHSTSELFGLNIQLKEDSSMLDTKPHWNKDKWKGWFGSKVKFRYSSWQSKNSIHWLETQKSINSTISNSNNFGMTISAINFLIKPHARRMETCSQKIWKLYPQSHQTYIYLYSQIGRTTSLYSPLNTQHY